MEVSEELHGQKKEPAGEKTRAPTFSKLRALDMVPSVQPLVGRPSAFSCSLPVKARPTQRSTLRVSAFALPKLDYAVEGPGTGLRQYPDPQHGQYEPRRMPPQETGGHHEMMSTEACYRMFPLITHASVPLKIEDQEPAGLTAQRVGDEGPATGRRRRPGAADRAAHVHSQVLPYPATHPTDLRRELLARHAPEVLLEQQRRPQA